MATKLRSPNITKVDLVDFGANPGARIALFKRDPGAGGHNLPDKTLKGGETNTKNDGIITNLVQWFGKRLGWTPDDIAKHMEDASTFNQELQERQIADKFNQVQNEFWDYTWALRESFENTLTDQTADREAMLRGSLDQFVAAVEDALPKWLNGETVIEKAGKAIAGHRMDKLKAMHQALGNMIKEAESTSNPGGGEPPMPAGPHMTPGMGITKGVDNPMPELTDIQKAALSPEARAYIQELETKITKGTPAPIPVIPTTGAIPEDVLKSLDPTVRVVVESLAKRAEAAENRAVVAEGVAKATQDKAATDMYIAKAREFVDVPGVNPDELGPILKSLADAKPEEYTKLENVLKSAAEAAKQSKLFEEFGKGGAGSTGGAMGKISAAAAEIRKSDPNLSMPQAIAKACEIHPELAEAYRKELK